MPILTTRRRRGMRGYLPGSSPIPVYSFLTGGGVLPAPMSSCGCKGTCGKCSTKSSRGWKRYNEIVTKRLGPGRYSILLSPGLGGLGQDDSGDVFGVPDPAAPNFGFPVYASYPASPQSGVVYAPDETAPYAVSGNPQPITPTTQTYQVSDSGVMPVLNNPALSYLSSGAAVPTTAASAMGGSLLWWLLGGAALVGVVVLSGSGKRR